MFHFPYPRTPTTARLRVEFPNGDVFEVPAQLVADSRDEHYADEHMDTIGLIRARRCSKGVLEEWSANNMNWADLSAHAVKVETAEPYEYEWHWGEAEKDIVGDI